MASEQDYRFSASAAPMRKGISRRGFAKRSVGYAAGIAGLMYASQRTARAEPEQADYIIVGSGPGGGPLAVNLARAGYKVVLIEAGPAAHEIDFLMSVPLFNPFVVSNPLVAWEFFVRHYANEAQQRRDTKYVADKGGVLYPRSSTIGGCASHNVLVMTYPSRTDWERIANITGDASWSPDNMHKYFERLEQCRYVAKPGAGEPNPTGHGFDGWQPTEMTDSNLYASDPQLQQILKATERRMGRPGVLDQWLKGQLDPNSSSVIDGDVDGLYTFPLSRLNGARYGIREHVLATAAALPNNLIIKNNALVTRVLFDGTTAIGVEYLDGFNIYRASPMAPQAGPEPGPRQQVLAAKEVIIAAGTFNSPQILKLSGIGPGDELSKFGITPVVDLPGVGANMQDRYEVGVVTELDQNFTLLKNCVQGPNDPCIGEFFQGQGIYTANLTVIANVRKTVPTRPERDLVITLAAGPFHGYYPGWEGPTTSIPNQFSWLILKTHTKNNAGTVTLRSADPRDVPEINFHYFDEGSDTAGEDLDSVVEGIKLARQVNAQLGAIINREIFPGPDVNGVADIRNFVKNEAWGHHASCSNKMGAANDPMAVVDGNFRVRGTKNLRVVDASVFPYIPGYYVMLPIMMISEKASDVILQGA